MAQIPSYEQWMKDTKSTVHKRSEFLERVDESLKPPQDKEAIRTALDRWRFEQSKQGKDWRKSRRNSKGAVTNLYRAVVANDRRKLSAEELEAMAYISRMQKMALEKQFMGKELTFKGSTIVGMAKGASSNWDKFKQGAQGLKTGGSTIKSAVKSGQSIKKGADLLKSGGRAAAHGAASADLKKKIMDLCKQLTPGLNPNEVFSRLGLGNVEQFSSNLAPFVGAISSGGKAVIGWIRVAKTAHEKSQIASARYAFAPEDPEAAFDAVLVLLNRELGSKTAKASVATGAFTGKLLGAFADAGAVTGPVVGLLETLADIFQTIVEYVRDYKEVEKANELLRVGYLNMDLFSHCPILGCYFLVIQDHSTIINMAVGDYGTPNFVFDAERLIKKVRPVLDKSRTYIGESRFEIANMEKAKGIATENWSVKGKFQKITGLPAHLTEMMDQKIEGWMGNPQTPPPQVDKSRIVGIGPNGYSP